ncbi:MAG TPA: potassium channel family protein [Glycomyces sp.]|nr:potassium channel family protein [Glycomyces sp.]
MSGSETTPENPPPPTLDPRWPPQLTAWERATNLPLFALALLFLGAYATPILYPGLPAWGHTIAKTVNVVVWVLYAADYIARLRMAGKGNRFRFVRSHPLDLLMVLLPMIRPLRVLRMVVLLVEVFRRQAQTTQRVKAAVYVFSVTGMILLVSSLAILDAERGARDPQVADFGDALWWAVVTASTVGYGDMVPQTTEGKIIAAFLMFAAIGLVGLVSGSLASWFVDRVTAAQGNVERAESAELRARLERLEAQLAEIHGAVVGKSEDEPVGLPSQRSKAVDKSESGR